MRRKAIRGLIQALVPALGVISRFRLAWLLRRRLLALPPRKWLRRCNTIDPPQTPPDSEPVNITVILDAREATAEAVAQTMRSLSSSRQATLTFHILAADNAADVLAQAWADDAASGKQRIWKAGELDTMLGLAATQTEYCLCVSLHSQCGIQLHEYAVAHLCAAMDTDKDLLFAYCDEIVQRGNKIDVFCKPAWDRVLFESLNYTGPAILLRSPLLGAVRSQEQPSCGLVEALIQAAARRRQGLVAHVPLPLLHVEKRDKEPYPPRRCIAQTPAHLHTGQRPTVSVIIPTRDRAELLAACLGTLRQTVTDLSRLEIILINNGSTCPKATALLNAEAACGSIVLHDAGDFNFSRLVNLGARAATGQFLLLLNNDIAFLEPGWLDDMLHHAVRKDVGCVGAKLLYRNGIVQHAGIVLGMHSILLNAPVAGHAHHGWPGSGSGYFRLLCCARSVSAVTGALLLVAKETFDAVCGFDEELAVALNDVDFCLKVLAHGKANIIVPAQNIVHLESASRSIDVTRPKLERLKAENNVLRERWAEALLDDAFYNPNVSLHLSYSLSRTPRPRKTRVRPVA